MAEVLAIGVMQAGTIGLAVGLIAGAVAGRWLAARTCRRREPPLSPATADAPLALTPEKAEPIETMPQRVADTRVEAPVLAMPTPYEQLFVEPAAVAPSAAPVDVTPLPGEVQALIDQGEVFLALQKLRKVSGGLAARRLAREQLTNGGVPLPRDIRRLVNGGNKIGAIQALCEQTHMDVTLARELVERHAAAPR